MPFQNFRPLPMRITHRQYERLQLSRDHDHLAIQEHVRRALDFYLDDLERRQGRSPSLKSPEPAKAEASPPPAAVPESQLPVAATKSNSKKKLVYR